MKAATGVLAALLIAAGAEARGLVVGLDTGMANSAQLVGAYWSTMAVTRTLNAFNVPYDLRWQSQLSFKNDLDATVPGKFATDSLRAGKLLVGSAGATKQWATYDWIIVAGQVSRGDLGGGAAGSGFYADSLYHLSRRWTWVPLIVVANWGGTTIADNQDTTGIFETVAHSGARDASSVLYQPGSWRTYRAHLQAPFRLKSDASVQGTMRRLIGLAATQSITGGCTNCDSAAMVLRPDTVVAFARYPWNGTTPINLPASAPRQLAPVVFLTMAYHFSAPPGNGSPVALLTALAFVDSLTGGKVFEPPSRIPLTWGVHIDDAFRTGNSVSEGQAGVAPSDTAQLKAYIDSLATLKAPFVVGVQVESLTVLSRHRAWWERAAPWVKYTPHDHTAGDGAGNFVKPAPAGFNRPLDMHSSSTRARLMAIGPCRASSAAGNDPTGGDSSVVCLAAGQLYAVERFFGRDRVDRVVMPTYDHLGLAATKAGNFGRPDSLISAYAQAGFVGGRTNSAYAAGIGSWANVYWTNYAELTVPFGTRAGSKFTILPTPSYGGNWSATDLWLLQTRMMNGLVWGDWQRYVGPAPTAAQGTVYGQQRIMAFHVAEFAALNRAKGWWALKGMVNSCAIINSFGRTIIKPVYPEEMCW